MPPKKEEVSEKSHAAEILGARPKYLDRKAFGKALSDLMNRKGWNEKDVANRVDLGGEYFTHEEIIRNAVAGNKSVPLATLTQISEADEINIPLPYTETPPLDIKKSPFGDRKKGGGMARGGSKPTTEGE